jgi:PAS domain-containing protein
VCSLAVILPRAPTGPSGPLPFEADRYCAILHQLPQAFCIVEVLVDAHGTATDYRLLEVNPAAAQPTGLPAAVGHTLRELAPAQEAYWFELLGEVAHTRQHERTRSWRAMQ